MGKRKKSITASEGAAAFADDAPSELPKIKSSRRPSWKALQESTLETATRLPVSQPNTVPWNSVSLLTFYRNGALLGHATGFLAGPDVILTAAHNIVMTNPTAVGVYPAFDAQLNPTASISAASWAWNVPEDLAVIILRVPTAPAIPVAEQNPQSVVIPGYAFGYPGGKPRMTYAQGACAISGDKLNYDAAVAKGDSGAPVLAPSGSGIVAAVHTNGRALPTGPGGFGTRITQPILQLAARLEAQARAALGHGGP